MNFDKNQKNEEANQVSKTSFFTNLHLRGIYRKISLLILMLIFVNNIKTSPGISYNFFAYNEDTVFLSKEAYYANSVRERIHDELVTQVKTYILEMAPESKLSAEKLVTVCENYDLNIMFVMAQALLESHFGTKGVAARTNSVWNVGTYDNGKILYKYNHPDESIEPYAKLLRDNYLMLSDSLKNNDRGLLNLLQDRGYINYDGNRFASARGYENALRKLIVKIDLETSIRMLESIRKLDDSQIISYFGPVCSDDNINNGNFLTQN